MAARLAAERDDDLAVDELERLWPVVLLSESSAGAAASTGASAASPAGPDEAELPTGTVTFLLTDIEGSTRLWEAVPRRWRWRWSGTIIFSPA